MTQVPHELELVRDRLVDAMVEDAFRRYPSPYQHRNYNYPGNYPGSNEVRRRLVSTLAFMENMLETSDLRDKREVETVEAMTAAYVSRRISYEWDWPVYLVSRPLVEMLHFTDKVEEDLVFGQDCLMPFPSFSLVLPKHLLGLPDGNYVVVLTVAKVDTADFKRLNRYVDVGERYDEVLYFHADMRDDVGFYGKFPISPEGKLIRIDDYRNLDLPEEMNTGCDRKPVIEYAGEEELIEGLRRLIVGLLFYLNCKNADVEPAKLDKKVTGKRGKKDREFWTPAYLGLNLTPTGFATQGSHASPTTHIRRGHFRRIAYGKGRSLRRREWFPPTLVNAGKAG